MQIVEYAHEFHVRITYNRFRVKNQNLVKQIPGARFDWPRKVFSESLDELIAIKNAQN